MSEVELERFGYTSHGTFGYLRTEGLELYTDGVVHYERAAQILDDALGRSVPETVVPGLCAIHAIITDTVERPRPRKESLP